MIKLDLGNFVMVTLIAFLGIMALNKGLTMAGLGSWTTAAA